MGMFVLTVILKNITPPIKKKKFIFIQLDTAFAPYIFI